MSSVYPEPAGARESAPTIALGKDSKAGSRTESFMVGKGPLSCALMGLGPGEVGGGHPVSLVGGILLWLALSQKPGQKLGKLSVIHQVPAVLGQWLQGDCSASWIVTRDRGSDFLQV